MKDWSDTYQTQVLQVNRHWSNGYITHLIIERHDKGEVLMTWSEIQEIKDEIIGKDVAMYEVYPMNNEIVNEVNKRHFWSFPAEMYLWRHI